MEYFVSLLFLSVISHLSPPHPFLVERQWAVTDDTRNEQHCHSPTSPLHFNELRVPQAVLPPPELRCSPVPGKCCSSIPVCLGGVCPVTQEGLSLLFTDKIVRLWVLCPSVKGGPQEEVPGWDTVLDGTGGDIPPALRHRGEHRGIPEGISQLPGALWGTGGHSRGDIPAPWGIEVSTAGTARGDVPTPWALR